MLLDWDMYKTEGTAVRADHSYRHMHAKTVNTMSTFIICKAVHGSLVLPTDTLALNCAWQETGGDTHRLGYAHPEPERARHALQYVVQLAINTATTYCVVSTGTVNANIEPLPSFAEDVTLFNSTRTPVTSAFQSNAHAHHILPFKVAIKYNANPSTCQRWSSSHLRCPEGCITTIMESQTMSLQLC
jgi:hypothetical protein